MGHPWDPFPLPIRGDLDEAKTFEGIGRVIDKWERIEFLLARIYSIFVGDPDGDALREFGTGRRNIWDKLSVLKDAAEQAFARRPNQKSEGDLFKWILHVEGFADRRNEIAHGIVYMVSLFTFFRQRTDRPDYQVQYAVIPAYHIAKHHNPNGIPKYMYASPEMVELIRCLDLLFLNLDELRQRLLKELR